MQNNALNNYPNIPPSPNAVSINIYSPQAYGSTNASTNPVCVPQGNFYPMYGPNVQPNLPLYPANYNNMLEKPQEKPENILPNNQANKLNNSYSQNSVVEETTTKKEEEKEENKTDKKKEKEKTITPLNDEYVKSLENYLNDANPKIRLIGAKELLERLKEDENRKDNPSLIPLVNKVLQDKSSAVRFLGLTMLQLDYCTGDDETVNILKKIQSENKDKIGEEQLLASEILLKMSAPEKIKLKEDAK